MSGRSALECLGGWSQETGDGSQLDGLTRFESLVVRSVRQALESVSFDVAGKNVAFILSTTKANMDYPGESAERICRVLGITTTPVVMCNACVSGLSAIILASRLLEQRQYDYAIVCGADVLSQFVTSGFESLKTVSAAPCRPFDIDRQGMNLGEAAATIVLGTGARGWAIQAGAVRNDAYDITAPSKKGEGAGRCLQAVLHGVPTSELALVNAHGVASLFMDQMESVAIERAGLAAVPVNSLKGYFGHTLGAAGVLETVLTMYALEQGVLIGTRGFSELGVSGQIQVSAQHQTTEKHSFIKMLSGFGGCNAALLASHGDVFDSGLAQEPVPVTRQTHRVVITPTRITVDGEQVACQTTGKQMLTELYKQRVGDYPRYYKMDMMSRLGFIASELLIQREQQERFVPTEHRAVILFNHSSSLHADKAYLETIRDPENYFPSPALFVYTLPNIVTGEIAIRNGYYGETSFCILPQRDEAVMAQVQQAAFCDPATESLISGWLDYENDEDFVADLYVLSK